MEDKGTAASDVEVTGGEGEGSNVGANLLLDARLRSR